MNATAAFARLHPGIQRWIWQQNWNGLRAIQVEAIDAILRRDSDVVISAPTAGGKTEAAFLPILSDLAQFEGPGLRCLSVAPLRALINDQTRRLEPICEATNLAFQPWHGDVSAGRATFWKRPANVLMTTPESLEALLMNRGGQFGALCRDLRFIVVDELHAFFGSERGAQLQSLLQRVQAYAPAPIPRVALSATLADTSFAGRFLRPDAALPTKVLTGGKGDASISILLRVVPKAAVATPSPPPLSNATEVDDDGAPTEPLPTPPGDNELPQDAYTDALSEITQDLFNKLRGDSHLIFANARNQVEIVADQLRERAESSGLPNEFFAHHGALSRELRVSLEERLREAKLPTSAVCTSTLEMGIDIGDVSSIAQIGAAPSVSALKQRVGRSGRRDAEPQILRQFVIAPQLDSRSHHLDFLRLPVLQAIATIELMLENRYEPPHEGELHLSTLVQQILSSIMQNGGGVPARVLYLRLCKDGAFRNVDSAMFVRVLRALGAAKVLEQSADGELLPGEIGERLTGHYSFYASFQTPEEYQLFTAGRRLGSLPVLEPLVVGQYMLFAGRRWKITSVDDTERVVLLEPARGGRPPKFGGERTGQHRIVHEKMRDVLLGTHVPAYLDKRAQEVLLEARAAARIYELDVASIYDAGGACFIAHWAGTRISTTLGLWLQFAGHSVEPLGPFVSLQASAEAARATLAELDAAPLPAANDLAHHASALIEDKFHWCLDRDLLLEAFAARHLDVQGAAAEVKRILGHDDR